MQCPNCGFESPPRMHYCGMCGNRLKQFCLTCGFANPLTFQFCGRCSGQLVAAPVTLAKRPVAEDAALGEPAPEPAVSAPRAARPAQPDGLAGERRVATIILADVRGSMDLLEQVGTEAWVEIMNQVFKILEAEIYRFGGKVDQFRGDGLVAFFGATSAHEDDPERAVLASLAMQRAIRPYAADLSSHDPDIDLRLRVGVNTGEVIVTSVGDRRRYSENTAMGEAIALAARMESAAEPGTVLVSENTYRLIPNTFQWKPLGKIMVKGISRPIVVYRPLAVRPDAERQQAYRLSNPLIGRDVEFDALIEYIEDLRTYGLGGIVTMTGERGLGKSLLLSEVRHHFARQNALMAEAYNQDDPASDSGAAVLELRGHCRSYQTQPYAVWLDVLRHWLRLQPNESKEEIRERLYRQAEAFWGERMCEYYPYLATFLSLPLEAMYQARIESLDAEGLRQQFFLAMRHWLEAMTRDASVVVTFSDMQWVDTTSLDLLKYCLSLCDQEALLWLFTFRPERSSPIWKFQHYLETEYPHRLTHLVLHPLTSEQSQVFIERMLGPDVLPDETEKVIIKKAEGNPYYIQELIRALIAQGVLIQEKPADDENVEADAATKWRATQAVTDLILPDSLQTLLMARIDQLEPEEQQALQKAAIIGEVFWSKVLSALIEDIATQKRCLTALQRAQLIRERGRTDLGVEYVFKSPLIRDAAYESLLSTQRMAYHLQVARHLETLLGPNVCEQNYGMLAHHYRQAGERDEELHYTLKAAKSAQDIYANVEAGEHYTHALEILEEMARQTRDEARRREILTRRFEALNARREVMLLTGNSTQRWADAKALLPLARQLEDDPRWLIDALLQQPGVADLTCREEVEAGIPMAQEALTLAREIGDKTREMHSLTAIANQRLMYSDPSWEEAGEEALEVARQAGDQRHEARILIGMGRIYATSDQPERSMGYLEAAAALSMSHALDDKITQAALLNLLGLDLERNGDYYRLLTEYEQERLLISREIGHRPMESRALNRCGFIQGVYLGDYEAGLDLLEEGSHIWQDSIQAIDHLPALAHLQACRGTLDEAQVALARIDAALAEVLYHDRGKASLNMIKAITYNALGDSEHLSQTLELAQETRRLARNNPLVSQQYEIAANCKAAEAHIKLARHARRKAESLRHQQEARDLVEAALKLYHQHGFVAVNECVSEEVLYRYSQVLTATGQETEAIKYLRRAYDEMIRKYALIPPDSHFRRTYLENIPLHQEIRAAYAARVGALLTDSSQLHHLVNLPESAASQISGELIA